MLNNLKKYLNLRYLLYFFALIAGWPCVFFLIGWLPHYTINYVLVGLLAAIFVFFRKKIRVPKPILCLFIVQILTWLFYSIIHGFDTSYFTRIFLLCVTYLFLEIQLSDDNLGFIKTYNFWLVFQSISGTIGLLLVLSGLLQPIFEFKELDMRPGYFFGFFTTNTYLNGLVRNAGFFDEPGALAFWGIYALIINKLFVENKKIEILLIFGLISTLSLAYYIQLLLYVCFFYKNKLSRILPYVAIFIVAILFVASFNDSMNRAVMGRLKYNEETGQISGDNRSDLMAICWDIFQSAPVFGQGAEHLIEISAERNVFVGANAFTNLAADGLVGQIILWSPFFFLFFLRHKNKKYGWAFWILIVGFLQRPYDCTQLLYPLMSFTIILHAYLSSDKISVNNENKKQVA